MADGRTDGVTADGSPVAAYAALPAEPELGVVRTLLAGARSVLDLGCGTGRIADPLAAAGLDVVAVDESEQMLGLVQHADPVRSPIGGLRLGRRFDAVLLLSQLVNGADAAELLAAAGRHLAPDGVLVVQRLEPGRPWRVGAMTIGPVTVELVTVDVDHPRVDGTTRYTVDGRSRLQHWTLWERDDAELAALCSAAGLRLRTADGPWVTIGHAHRLSPA